MAGDEVSVYGRQVAGGWVAAVEKEHVGPPGARAPRFRQRVVRQGPGDPQPVVLYEQTSTGSVRIHLRDDGLLLIQPVGLPPRLHFPDSKEPVELELPPPQQWQYPFSPDTKIGTTWFLDDCLLYSRMAYPGHLLIGYVRIDAAERASATFQQEFCRQLGRMWWPRPRDDWATLFCEAQADRFAS